MKPEQLKRLQHVTELVAEEFIIEADPNNWSGGANVSPKDLDKTTRGNRHWDKKNAILTGTLLARMMDLAEGRTKEAKDDDESEKKVDEYEARAQALLNDVERRRQAKEMTEKIIEKAHGAN